MASIVYDRVFSINKSISTLTIMMFIDVIDFISILFNIVSKPNVITAATVKVIFKVVITKIIIYDSFSICYQLLD